MSDFTFYSLKSLKPLLFMALIICGMALKSHAQATYFVKANAAGNNSGTSWANAFSSLQSALESAQSGDQIWVAAGTYVPSKDINGNASPANARTKTFLLKNGVKIYGGFAGTEATLAARNIAANASILSGDLDGNDAGGFTNTAANAYHVTVAHNLTTATLLDGFTIKAGNANLTEAFIGEVWGHHHGGGMLAVQTSTHLTVNACIFTQNYGGFGGGAVYHSSSSPRFTNTVFTHNKCSNSYGGAMYLNFNSSSTSLINCIFVSNYSGYQGGALYNWAPSTSIINCTFALNFASHEGAGIHNRSANPVITNTVIYGNTGGGSVGISNESSTPVVTYSTVQGGYAGTGNKSLDPVFTGIADGDGPDNLWRTADDGLALRASSPAANTGSNAAVPAGTTADIIGDARILNTTVNMGAYETLLPARHYFVKATASGLNNGSSWANAFTSLQSALDLALSGDQVWVAAGTYKPSKDINGSATPDDARTKTFILKNGVKLYGGFAGTEAVLTSRNVAANPTILSGDIDNNDGDNFAGNSSNAYHVTVSSTLSAQTVMDGFTVTGGNANVTTAFLGEVWGHHHGGGLLAVQTGTNLTINNCVFKYNYGGFGGGAIYHSSSSPKIYNSVFANNSCSNSYGGAMYLSFSSNATSIVNCVFTGNYSGYQGGAIYNWAPATTIINSTFYDNYATHEGGGIHNRTYSPTITNTIIAGNKGGGSKQISNESSAAPVVSYSLIEGGHAGTGNLNVDPRFYKATDADGADNRFATNDDGLILSGTSPAIDAGSNSAIPAGITTDLIGVTRTVNSVVNLGAYEYTVEKIAQSIQGLSATDTRHYGDANYALIVTGGASGLPVTFTSSNTLVATVTGNVISIKGVGQTVITASQAGNDMYFAAPNVTQTLTVVKGLQEISNFPEAETVTYGEVHTLAATGGPSGQLVTYTSSNPAVATIVGRAVSIQGAGETIITARQAGNDLYEPAENALQYLTVLKADQTISFDAVGDVTLDAGTFDLVASSSSSLEIDFTSTSDRIELNGKSVTLLKAGPVTITAAQSGNDNYYASESIEQTFCILPLKPSISITGPGTESLVLTSDSDTDNKWYRNGQEIAGASGKTLEVQEPGNYTVAVAIEGCLSPLSDAAVFIVTGIEETPENKVQVYPNPVRSDLFVDVRALSHRGTATITVYSVTGELLATWVSTGVGKLSMSSYPSGTYLIKIENGSEVVIKRFVKQ
jgi:hypothetical protein